MTFTRTSSGIKNYSAFYNVDFVIFIEGKLTANESSSIIPDKYYYEKLISSFLINKKLEIKCVGNKQAALAYLRPIVESGAKDSLIIIDRDYDWINCSLLDNSPIVYTYGYSWENDIWNFKTASAVLMLITLNNTQAATKFQISYTEAIKRLAILCRLDAASQTQKKSLLKKNSGFCGISINSNSNEVISYSELKRLIKKFRASCDLSCPLLNSAISATRSVDTSLLIQGHLLASVVGNMIGTIFKATTGVSIPPHNLILTLLLNTLSSNPQMYMENNAYQYYRDTISAKLI